MTDHLISRADALAECQKVADEAKSYGIPQMSLGAHTCRDAIRALPAYEAEVRELEWVKHPSKDIWRAKTGFGEYKVFGLLPAATWDFDSWSDAKDKISASSGSPEAAKAAAQADYAARIRSALTATPAQDVDGLVEVLKYYEAQFCEGFCEGMPDLSVTNEGMENDCSGCKARAALARMKETKA